MSRAARTLLLLALLVILYEPTRYLWAWWHRADGYPIVDAVDLTRAYWVRAPVGIIIGVGLVLLAARIERGRGRRE